jgi:hypothetical protein
MNFLHSSFVDEMMELTHPSHVKPTIALSLRPVNHVEVSTDYPWIQPNLPQLMKLVKEYRLVTVPQRALNRRKPPIMVTRGLSHTG